MDIQYMELALQQAETAYRLGEVPIGAVIVRGNEVISTGYNMRDTQKNALLHAEAVAIHRACQRLGGWQLWQCELYVTVEPCPMCAGAIINSRICSVYYGAKNPKAGCCESVVNLFELPFNHKPNVTGGILEDRCGKIMTDFFSQLREKKKLQKQCKNQ